MVEALPSRKHRVGWGGYFESSRTRKQKNNCDGQEICLSVKAQLVVSPRLLYHVF
jgi:hypothetical protein